MIQVEFLSPSSFGTWLMCQFKWKYDKIDKRPRGQSGAALIGTAFHAAVETNYASKIKSFEDMPLSILLEAADDAFAAKAGKVKWEGEPKNENGSRSQVHDLVEHYIKVHAPLIQPKFVEEGIEFEINGVKIRGTLDLIDTNDILIDHKTIKSKPNSVGVGYKIQSGIYRRGAEDRGIEIKKVRIDYIVKTIKPYMRPLLVEAEDSLVVLTDKLVGDIDRACKDDHFQPNPDGWWCSKKWCDHHPDNDGPCPYGSKG